MLWGCFAPSEGITGIISTMLAAFYIVLMPLALAPPAECVNEAVK